MRQCTIPGCEKKSHSTKMCSMHEERRRIHGDPLYEPLYLGRTTHGKTYTTEYNVWCGIKARCLNSNSQFYSHYGARGITICDRWLHSFENFLADMGERPKGTTLDRKDNNQGYTPENCRWAFPHQQASNKRNNNKAVGVSFDNQTKKWNAQLCINGKSVIFPRRYNTFEEALEARRKAEIVYLGYKIN